MYYKIFKTHVNFDDCGIYLPHNGLFDALIYTGQNALCKSPAECFQKLKKVFSTYYYY